MLMTENTFPSLKEDLAVLLTKDNFRNLRLIVADKILKELAAINFQASCVKPLVADGSNFEEVSKANKTAADIQNIRVTVDTYIQGGIAYDFMKDYIISLDFKLRSLT